MSMEFSTRTFSDLSVDALYDILQLRSSVFVVEQTCAYLDPDGADRQAVHMMGAEGGRLAAYARIFGPHATHTAVRIGRVSVHPDFRGRGLGIRLMEACIAYAGETWPATDIELEAQSYLLKFYGDLGFEIRGEEYLEDGIPHTRMLRSARD